MAKTAAQKQKEYRDRLKTKDNTGYLNKEKKRKNDKLNLLKMATNVVQYKNFLRKDRDRKAFKNKENCAEGGGEGGGNSSGLGSFSTRQSYGKSLARAKRSLPNSPSKKKIVIASLVQEMSPSSKKDLYAIGRKTRTHESWKVGRNKISNEKAEKVTTFLESPAISYCMPGRKDTIYCGKNIETLEKIYKSRHYLNWSLNEIVAMYNNEYPDDPITYYTVQSLVKKNKHIQLSGEYPSDDCRCQDCENIELFLLALKRELRNGNRSDLASNVNEDPATFLENFMCSLKIEDCVNAICVDCPDGNREKIKDFLFSLDEFNYAQWVHEEKIYKKVQITEERERGRRLFH